MRITYTETFPKQAPPDAESAMRLIHKIINEHLATEVLKKLAKEKPCNIA